MHSFGKPFFVWLFFLFSSSFAQQVWNIPLPPNATQTPTSVKQPGANPSLVAYLVNNIVVVANVEQQTVKYFPMMLPPVDFNISPNGRTVVVASKGYLTVIDVPTGNTTIFSISANPVKVLATDTTAYFATDSSTSSLLMCTNLTSGAVGTSKTVFAQQQLQPFVLHPSQQYFYSLTGNAATHFSLTSPQSGCISQTWGNPSFQHFVYQNGFVITRDGTRLIFGNGLTCTTSNNNATDMMYAGVTVWNGNNNYYNWYLLAQQPTENKDVVLYPLSTGSFVAFNWPYLVQKGNLSVPPGYPQPSALWFDAAGKTLYQAYHTIVNQKQTVAVVYTPYTF